MASARLVAGLAAHWLRVHAQLGNRVAVLFASLTVDVLARGGRAGRPWSSPGTAESPADVTGRADQEPPHPRVAEELETPPHVRGGRVRVRERREIGADAAVGVEYGEDLPRVLHSSIRAYFASFPDAHTASADMRRRFKFLGE